MHVSFSSGQNVPSRPRKHCRLAADQAKHATANPPPLGSRKIRRRAPAAEVKHTSRFLLPWRLAGQQPVPPQQTCTGCRALSAEEAPPLAGLRPAPGKREHVWRLRRKMQVGSSPAPLAPVHAAPDCFPAAAGDTQPPAARPDEQAPPAAQSWKQPAARLQPAQSAAQPGGAQRHGRPAAGCCPAQHARRLWR